MNIVWVSVPAALDTVDDDPVTAALRLSVPLADEADTELPVTSNTVPLGTPGAGLP
jgi:hypothetical protein